MDKGFEELSKSRQVAVKTIYEAFLILKENGGQLQGKEVIDKIRERVKFNEWEKEIYEKSGYVRWESILHFFTIDCIKAGYLRKNKGVWYLTEEGEKAIKLGPVKLLANATKLYREWAEINIVKTVKNEQDEEELEENQIQLQKANLDQLEEQAIAGIKEHIFKKNAYEFQDLVAALLRAMKYHTPFISPKGRDGGLDIIAFRDPLGASEPRIKVQVKHKPQSAVPPSDIRSLIGLLNGPGDIGLFVTSGTFSSESERTARESRIHIKLIDINYFIQLWLEFYNILNDEEKNMLPLHPIYFLGSND
ncbi:MAG: Mrr restriction system protein [Ignavibacteria bacterium]|jgi:restriction system protein